MRPRQNLSLSKKLSIKIQNETKQSHHSKKNKEVLIGLDAIIHSGFPHRLIAYCVTEAEKLNAAIAVRVGQEPKIADPICKNFPYAIFKPMELKTKTCQYEQGIPMLAGYIAKNQAVFGRKDSVSIPSEFGEIQLYVSLQEIFKDANKDYYEVIAFTPSTLILRVPKATGHKDLQLCINLNQGQPILNLAEKSKPHFYPWKIETHFKQPVCWTADYPHFHECATCLFPVTYKCSDEAEFAPLYIVANNGHPITGDADLLWAVMKNISDEQIIKYQDEIKENKLNHLPIPTSLAWAALPREVKNKFNKKFNTKEPQELSHLLNHYSEMLMQLNLISDVLLNITDFAKSAGIISAYELLITKLINEEVNKDLQNYTNLIQHGPEINNPGKPSSLDDTTLIIIDGKPILTYSELQLVELLVSIKFFKDYYVPVHPKWDMSLWGKVIEKQLLLNQEVHPETLVNYNKNDTITLGEISPVNNRKINDLRINRKMIKTAEKNILSKSAPSLFQSKFPPNNKNIFHSQPDIHSKNPKKSY